jgi:hypothetical protein
MTALAWKSNTSKGRETLATEMIHVCFPRGVGNVTYHAYSVKSPWPYDDVNRCCAILTGPGGGKQKVSLGDYRTMDEAKRACEQHYANGCDLSKAHYIARSLVAAV